MIFDPASYIHNAEPGQAVFLNPKAYRVVESDKNPDYFGTHSYSVGYWKDIITKIFSKIASIYDGKTYWKDKLPHVDVTVDNVDMTIYMSEYSAIFLKYGTREYRCDEVDLDEMTEEEATKTLLDVMHQMAKAAKFFDNSDLF